MNHSLTGVVLVLLSAAGFATLAIFIKYAYAAGANTVTILAARFTLAAACLWLILYRQNPVPLIDKKNMIRLFFLGAIGYGAMSTAFASSLLYLPASLASLLLYLYPALVTILAIVLGQDQLSWPKAGALALCFAGLLLLLGIHVDGVSTTGVFWGIASAVIYSLYIMAGNFLLAKIDPLVVTTYVCTAAATLFSLYALGSGQFITTLPLAGWLAIGGIAFFSTVVAILGFFAGMAHIGPANASIISTVEPLLTVVMSILFLGETITLIQWSGGLLILLGIMMLQRKGRKSEEKPTLPSEL